MKKVLFGKGLITALLLCLCCVTVSGCKKDAELPDNVLIKITEPATPSPTPTPTPVPTPIIDRPDGRYDALKQPRNEEDETPEEITFDDETTEVPDCPILHIRTRLSHMEADGWVTDDKEIDDGVYINLINMNAENSEILELLKDVMKDV